MSVVLLTFAVLVTVLALSLLVLVALKQERRTLVAFLLFALAVALVVFAVYGHDVYVARATVLGLVTVGEVSVVLLLTSRRSRLSG